MAKRLDDAIDEIQAEMGKVSGIRSAPKRPPEKLPATPCAVCFPASGSVVQGSVGTKHKLHDIVLQIHGTRKDLARDVDGLIDIGERVFEKLLDGDTITLSNTVDTIYAQDPIEYTFGSLTYADQDTIGWSFVIHTKIQTST